MGFLVLSLFLGFLPRFDLLREVSAESEEGLTRSWVVDEDEVEPWTSVVEERESEWLDD